MKDKKGILAALDAEISLEDKIAFELHKVLSDDSPTEKYSDRRDIQNVRRRELIVAALHAILQDQIDKLTDDNGSANIELADDINPFSELSAAFRDLLHDVQRLNEGMQAELVAAPVYREAIEAQNVISAPRKLRIMWYAAAELHCNKDKHLYTSKAALERHAARILNSSQKSLSVERSKLKKCGKDEEQALFYNFINTSKSLAKASRDKYTALELFLPAVQVLASETIFNFSRKVN